MWGDGAGDPRFRLPLPGRPRYAMPRSRAPSWGSAGAAFSPIVTRTGARVPGAPVAALQPDSGGDVQRRAPCWSAQGGLWGLHRTPGGKSLLLEGLLRAPAGMGLAESQHGSGRTGPLKNLSSHPGVRVSSD